MLSIIIVDDEGMARARLRRLLSSEPDVQIVAECADGRDGVRAIVEHAPDLVFLDIEMPELSGFQVLEALPPSSRPAFVFVTAFSNFAIDAFRVDALDYLLKPFDAARFRATMQRARDHLVASQRQLLTAMQEISEAQREIRAALLVRSAAAGSPSYLQRIAIKSDGRTFFVRVEDIEFVQAAANYVKLHVGAECHFLRETLGNLAGKLDPARFARIHRATIINIDRVREMQPWFSGDAIVIMKGGQKLRLSRVYRSALEPDTKNQV